MNDHPLKRLFEELREEYRKSIPLGRSFSLTLEMSDLTFAELSKLPLTYYDEEFDVGTVCVSNPLLAGKEQLGRFVAFRKCHQYFGVPILKADLPKGKVIMRKHTSEFPRQRSQTDGA